MRFASVLGAAALTAAGIALSASDLGTAPAVAASTDRPAADTFGVDLSHSNILFKCLHLGVSYQWGRFDDFEGSFTLDDDAAKSAVNITIQAASVNSNSVDRDKHLRAPDFFDVKQFPTIGFTSTKVESTGEGTFKITGDLSFHGVTKSIEMDVTKVGEADAGPRFGTRAGFEGSFTIQRADFGVGTFPEMLGGDVTMMFAIEGMKK